MVRQFFLTLTFLEVVGVEVVRMVFILTVTFLKVVGVELVGRVLGW